MTLQSTLPAQSFDLNDQETEQTMKTFHAHLLALLTLAATLTACPDPPKDPPKVPDFTFSLVPASSNLERNKTLNVAVSLNRVNNFADAVNITLSNPPAGLSANPLTIDAASSSGNLIVQATSSAALGAAKLTVNALGGGLGKTQDLNLTVIEATTVTPPTVTVDTALKPAIADIPDPNGGAPRPLASLSSRSGGQMDFVLNEMLIVTDDKPKLDALLARWGGTVVQETNFDAIAKIFKTGTATGPHYYLVRVNPASADPAGLPDDLQKLTKNASGDFKVSSTDTLKFLAALTSEASDQSMSVSANLMISPASITTGSTVEGTASAGFVSNAFTWDYMGSGAGFPMNTGVAQAWQSLENAGKFVNKIGVLVADGGFSPSTAGLDLPPVTAFGATEAPNPFPCAGAGGARGACRWHGSNVMQALAAVPDNSLGAAGPAGPIANLSFVQSPVASVGPGFDIGGVIRSIGNTLEYLAGSVDALSRRPRVLNFSGSFKVDGGWGFLVTPLDGMFSFFKDSLGILTFAAAGNDGAIDVDADACYGIGSPSVCAGVVAESDVFVPCEMSAVICVGGLTQNAITKDTGSTFGSKQRFAAETTDDAGANDSSVDIYGPFSVFVGPDPDNAAVRRASGTSFSSPFIAGVAALIWAADPSLSADQVQRILLETSHHTNDLAGTRGGLRVNALGAITRVLGNPPALTVARSGFVGGVPFTGDAPLNRDFQIDALATDPDGAAGCCTITWQPAPTGEVALVGGRRATYRITTTGSQVITATARDSNGNTTRSSITIGILNNPPVATMSLPSTTITVFRGQPVLFRGFATDANEGSGSTPANLACNKLTWTDSNSSDPGFPKVGTGTPPNCEFSYTFTTNGSRSISLTATDSQGLAVFAPPGRLINVVDPPVNLPPNINLGTLPPLTYSDGYAWDVAIPITASATDPENNTPITYRWTATTYRPNSATLFAGPTFIQGFSTTSNLNWTPFLSNPTMFGTFTDFGNPCYDGQTVKLVLEAKDSLGNISSITLPNITVFRCILI
jgi:serine protease